MHDVLPRPVRYDPGVERPAPDEAHTIAGIIDAFGAQADTVAGNEGHAVRAGHAKATGLLKGGLVVAPDLPVELAQGLFAKAGRHDLLMRFAQGAGETLSDRISVSRGASIKILGVHGAHIPESRETTTQDFTFQPGTAFIHSTPKAFHTHFRLGPTNAGSLPDGLKLALSDAARAANAALKTVGAKSKILDFYGHPSLHPLADNYFSQAPLRWGDHIAKLAIVPSDDTLDAIGDAAIDARGDPDAFRTATVRFFDTHAAAFDLRAQLCTDLTRMPVEDASVDWPQDESPYLTVATIHLPRQAAWSEARARYFDERLAFQPAHSLVEHRPLGGIMRARLAAYPRMQDHRQRRNGFAPAEPRVLADVPD